MYAILFYNVLSRYFTKIYRDNFMNETPEQQAPVSAPTQAEKQNYTKWIIVGVGVLVVLYIAQSFLSPERAIERAIEQSAGGDVDVDIDRDGSVRMKGDNGEEYNVSAGNNVSLPDNWPSSVPLPSDINVSYAGSMNAGDTETAGLSVVYTTKDSTTEVAEYFKSTLEKEGWKIQATVATGDGSMVTASKGEEENVAVYIGGAEGETTVNVSIQQPK